MAQQRCPCGKDHSTEPITIVVTTCNHAHPSGVDVRSRSYTHYEPPFSGWHAVEEDCSEPDVRLDCSPLLARSSIVEAVDVERRRSSGQSLKFEVNRTPCSSCPCTNVESATANSLYYSNREQMKGGADLEVQFPKRHCDFTSRNAVTQTHSDPLFYSFEKRYATNQTNLRTATTQTDSIRFSSELSLYKNAVEELDESDRMEDTIKEGEGEDLPGTSKDDSSERIAEGSLPKLPILMGRYHGPGCAMEICIMEKHDPTCKYRKERNADRDPIDDKNGAYDVIGRMSFRTCGSQYLREDTATGKPDTHVYSLHLPLTLSADKQHDRLVFDETGIAALLKFFKQQELLQSLATSAKSFAKEEEVVQVDSYVESLNNSYCPKEEQETNNSSLERTTKLDEMSEVELVPIDVNTEKNRKKWYSLFFGCLSLGEDDYDNCDDTDNTQNTVCNNSDSMSTELSSSDSQVKADPHWSIL